MTNRELLRTGADRLGEAGIEDADTDALLLFEHVTGIDRSGMLISGDEEADEAAVSRYEGLLLEREGHRPVQYITGVADFMGLRFHVDENVLIPRFDTEFLVEEMMREVDDGSSVLDMCTGSGCILLSFMSYKNDIDGTGADISEAALALAEKNEELIFGLHNPSALPDHPHRKVEWICSDMFGNVTEKYDCIVSNPPYIQSGAIPTLMSEVKDHEPMQALDGGDDGLDFYRIIASEAGAHLKRYGKLFLEIGYDEGEDVSALLKESGFRDIRVLRDYSGNDRVVIGEWYV